MDQEGVLVSLTWEPRENWGMGRTHDEALFEQIERSWGYDEEPQEEKVAA